MESIFKELLQKTGDDLRRPGLENTPLLAARAFEDLTKGYGRDPAAILRQVKIKSDYSGTIELPELAFMSLCEHTFLPFLGSVNISYQPRGHIAGIGGFKEIIEAFSKRLQLQEKLTTEMAEVIMAVLEPKWVKINILARHCCMNGQEVRTQIICPDSLCLSDTVGYANR